MTTRRSTRILARRLSAWALMAAAIGGVHFAGAPAMAQTAPNDFATTSAYERGVTKPKEEPKLVFVAPGVVRKINVKEGQIVKKDEVLAVQDDRDEAGKVEVAKGEIASAQMQVEAAQADLDLKKVMLKRKEDIYAEQLKAGMSFTEVDEARVALKIADISIQFRQTELAKAKLQLLATEIQLEQRKLISPIDGVVVKIDVKVGEGSDLSRPVMQVVQVDMLTVEADIATTKAKALKVGDVIQVRYPDEDKWMPATITFMTKYANAASGTRKIKLELKNDADREAGLPVYVKLPDNLASGR